MRRLPDGTYQLFYKQGDYFHLAASTDGITFTTQITNLLNLSKILPPITDAGGSLWDFAVVDVEGEDWFYLNYCTELSVSGRCINSHIAVSRPIHRTELSLTKSVTPTTLHPGDPITYTLIFSNVGKDTATGIVITDILPSALISPNISGNISITNTGYTPGYVWKVQNLSPGNGGVIIISARINPAWSPGVDFSNVATITTTAIETNTTNNIATTNNFVTAPETLPGQYTYLPTILHNWPLSGFPIHIGNAIPRYSASHQGETFYSRAVSIPAPLPSGGHFYFSTKPDSVTKILVDDQLIVQANRIEVFSYNFSTSGSPVPATVEMPRVILERLSGKTATIAYRDIYGVDVEATDIWLVWVP